MSTFDQLVARQGGVVALWQAVEHGMSAASVPAGAKPRPQPDVRLRRRDLHGADLILTRDVRVAAKPFAALETAVVIPNGSTFLDRSLQRHVRFPALYRSFCRNMGRDGSPEAGRLITAAADRADSAAERLLVALLRRAGVGGWTLGLPFGPYRIDLAFPAVRVAVEVCWTETIIWATWTPNASATTAARGT